MWVNKNEEQSYHCNSSASALPSHKSISQGKIINSADNNNAILTQNYAIVKNIHADAIDFEK
jgi:hypothetical protein